MNRPEEPAQSQTVPNDAPPPPVFGDRFQVVRMLGAGAMGDVYLAEDTKLQRRVAIKCIRAEHQAQSILLQRIKRECLLHARIGAHPHIVTLYDLLEGAGQLLIVMEYVEGEPLDKRMKRYGQTGIAMEPKECLEIVLQCLEALAHTHGHGVIHRDIKPANVILDSQSPKRVCAKLMDFGIARLEEDDPNATTLTQPGSRSPGTPLYMAPEQIDSGAYGAVTPAADLYAVGVMLYHLLAGRPPFSGTMTDIFNGHLNFAPKAITLPDGGALHPGLWAVMEKAMAKRPAERHASAEAFAADLRPFLTPEFKIAPGRPSRGRGQRPFARRRGGWGIAVALICVAAAGGGWFWRGQGLLARDAVTAPTVTTTAIPGPSEAEESAEVAAEIPVELPAIAPPPEPIAAPVAEPTPTVVMEAVVEAPVPASESVAATDSIVPPEASVPVASDPGLPPIIPPATSEVAIVEAENVDSPPVVETGAVPVDVAMEGELEAIDAVASPEIVAAAPAGDDGGTGADNMHEAGESIDLEGVEGMPVPVKRTHVVVAGDTLESIARKYAVKEADLIRWNRLKEPVTLEPERVLYLYERPASETETTGQDSSGRPIQVFKEDLKDVLDKSKEGLRNLGRKVRNVGK